MAQEIVLSYPWQLGWSYLLLAGYAARVIFKFLHLPGVVGIFFVGYAFSYFMQVDIWNNRDRLQTFAFFLVLLNAGFELHVRDMKPRVVLLAIFPAALELLGIATYTCKVQDFTLIESLVVGCILFPIGEGLVIPRMNEFRIQFPSHPMPRLVLTWAPIEATFALTVFGFLAGIAGEDGKAVVGGWTLMYDAGMRMLATLILGSVLGGLTACALSRVKDIKPCGTPVFSGSAVEAFLIVLGLTLGVFGMSEEIPMPFGPEGSKLFEAQLFVIVFGSAFSQFCERAVFEGVEGYLMSIWTFGSIILFSMLGSRTSMSVFQRLPEVLPIMMIGFTCRLVGFLIAGFTSPTMVRRGKRIACADILFLFLSSLPRASIQGALGSWPLTHVFFSNDESDERAQTARQFIAASARLYIVCNAVIGSLLVEIFGPMLLKFTGPLHGARPLKEDEEDSQEEAEEGSSNEHSSCSSELFDSWSDLPLRFGSIYRKGTDD